ncbi:hypothetical protein [Sorangium sp. So ce426]|uniref:hypothetical protein n=1 Tax=Sorangium sp. So ce426 TaxID=3133312 RepID=UPI003F5C6D2F
MPEYFTRLKTPTDTVIHRFQANDFTEACRIAWSHARAAGAVPTATNLVEKFRLKAGERIVEQAGIPNAATALAENGPAAFEPLDLVARREICLLALRGLRLADTPHLRRLGHFLLDRTLWFWTADALVKGEYVRDAVKRELSALPHTEAAARAKSPSELRHEHAVPRKIVRKHLTSRHARWSDVAEDEAVAESAEVLDRCPPVLVTIEEDRKLGGKLRAGMGEDGSFEDPPFVRYERAGIVKSVDELHFPKDGLWTPEGRYRSSAGHR